MKKLLLENQILLHQLNQLKFKLIKKRKPTKKNTFKIDSSNLDNFDLVSNDSETQLHNDKEYEIDLEALREKLKKTTVEPKDKDKEASQRKTEN